MLKLTSFRETALDFVFPRVCLGCNWSSVYICPDCSLKLIKISPPFCPRCGRPQIDGALCPVCFQNKSSIDLLRSVFIFEGIIRKAIIELKYNNIRALAKELAVMMSEYYKDSTIPGEILVPVPLHSRRLKNRGYNQSFLLSHYLGNLINLPVSSGCLVRTRDTSPQVLSVGYAERLMNVSGAFTCRNDSLNGKSVIIVDDVYTSGATLEACAEALRDSGCTLISGFTLAREE